VALLAAVDDAVPAALRPARRRAAVAALGVPVVALLPDLDHAVAAHGGVRLASERHQVLAQAVPLRIARARAELAHARDARRVRDALDDLLRARVARRVRNAELEGVAAREEVRAERLQRRDERRRVV